MLSKSLFLVFLPLLVQAQPRKNELNISREVGLTANHKAYGVHYSWQAQVSKTLYVGMGVEGLRVVQSDKENVHKENVVPATFRISHMSDIEGLRLVPYLSAGVVLTQPNGTMLEGGLGVAAGKWQLSAAYRNYSSKSELLKNNSGVILRLSRLLISEATRPYYQ